MKTQFRLIVGSIGALRCVPLASGADHAALAADRVSVFKAPLVCPAAPQIGCGIASKPILLDLEKQTGVLEAWLNRAGTIIAVVWKPEASAEDRRKVAAELKEDRAMEMEGTSREHAVTDFLSGKGWYHGADVDRLSEEEASIIAARLVRFIKGKTNVTAEKADALQQALNDALRKDLTGEYARLNQKPRRLEDIARQYLDGEQIKILRQAIKDEEAIGSGERRYQKKAEISRFILDSLVYSQRRLRITSRIDSALGAN
jgi:hypothetical protein